MGQSLVSFQSVKEGKTRIDRLVLLFSRLNSTGIFTGEWQERVLASNSNFLI